MNLHTFKMKIEEAATECWAFTNKHVLINQHLAEFSLWNFSARPHSNVMSGVLSVIEAGMRKEISDGI